MVIDKITETLLSLSIERTQAVNVKVHIFM